MSSNFNQNILFDMISKEYDSIRPELADSLAILVKSIITKFKEETPNFISFVRRYLTYVYDYNCQVAKVTGKFPTSKHYESLLLKYVELEYDALYREAPFCTKTERRVEERVVSFIQFLLHKAVLPDEAIIDENSEMMAAMAVLKLLSKMAPEYLHEHRFIVSSIKYLIKRLGLNVDVEEFLQRILMPTYKGTSPTSDYGTDDSDSDSSNHYDFITKFNETLRSNTETTNETAVPNLELPTIELSDDERPKSSKYEQEGVAFSENGDSRKVDKKLKLMRKKRRNASKKVVTFEILDDECDTGISYKMSLKKEVEKVKKEPKLSRVDDSTIVLDSDDDSPLVILDDDDETNDFNYKVLRPQGPTTNSEPEQVGKEAPNISNMEKNEQNATQENVGVRNNNFNCDIYNTNLDQSSAIISQVKLEVENTVSAKEACNLEISSENRETKEVEEGSNNQEILGLENVDMEENEDNIYNYLVVDKLEIEENPLEAQESIKSDDMCSDDKEDGINQEYIRFLSENALDSIMIQPESLETIKQINLERLRQEFENIINEEKEEICSSIDEKHTCNFVEEKEEKSNCVHLERQKNDEIESQKAFETCDYLENNKNMTDQYHDVSLETHNLNKTSNFVEDNPGMVKGDIDCDFSKNNFKFRKENQLPSASNKIKTEDINMLKNSEKDSKIEENCFVTEDSAINLSHMELACLEAQLLENNDDPAIGEADDANYAFLVSIPTINFSNSHDAESFFVPISTAADLDGDYVSLDFKSGLKNDTMIKPELISKRFGSTEENESFHEITDTKMAKEAIYLSNFAQTDSSDPVWCPKSPKRTECSQNDSILTGLVADLLEDNDYFNDCLGDIDSFGESFGDFGLNLEDLVAENGVTRENKRKCGDQSNAKSKTKKIAQDVTKCDALIDNSNIPVDKEKKSRKAALRGRRRKR